MLDNTITLIGTIVSPIKSRKNGNFEFKYFALEVETGSKEDKPNTIWVKVPPKIMEKLNWEEGQDYSGSQVAVGGILVGTMYNNNNYINLETKEIGMLVLKQKNRYNAQPQYTPENNYGLPPQEDLSQYESRYELSDDDLPF